MCTMFVHQWPLYLHNNTPGGGGPCFRVGPHVLVTSSLRLGQVTGNTGSTLRITTAARTTQVWCTVRSGRDCGNQFTVEFKSKQVLNTWTSRYMYICKQMSMHPQTFIILAEVNSVNPNEIYKGPCIRIKTCRMSAPLYIILMYVYYYTLATNLFYAPYRCSFSYCKYLIHECYLSQSINNHKLL